MTSYDRCTGKALAWPSGTSNKLSGKPTASKRREQPIKKPRLILPDGIIGIVDCAAQVFKGLATTDSYFVRNDELVKPVNGENGLMLKIITKREFVSELERHFELVSRNAKGELTPALCDKSTAEDLLYTTEELPKYSLPLRLIAASPVLIGDGRVLQRGYHPVEGGLYVERELDIPEISLPDAIELLTEGLFADYDFVSPSDASRAVSQVLSPCFKLGNLLPEADYPIDLGQGDQSQSGKTHRMRFTAAIYGEKAYTVINKKGGVGSLDESVAAALCSGKLFVLFDNVRGEFDSQLLESVLRGTGFVSVRLPYRQEVTIRTDRIITQLTSNAATLTRDLANRAIIVNNRKQPPGYEANAKLPWGEDFLQYIYKYQAEYLGSVHRVVREWLERGRPRTPENRHSFTAWVQSMDWIVQNIFKLPPLMEGHVPVQKAMSNPDWTWFRQIVLATAQSARLGEKLQAFELLEISDTHGIKHPKIPDNADEKTRNQAVGRILGPFFKDGETVVMEDYTVTRTIERSLGYQDTKKYTVRTKI